MDEINLFYPCFAVAPSSFVVNNTKIGLGRERISNQSNSWAYPGLIYSRLIRFCSLTTILNDS